MCGDKTISLPLFTYGGGHAKAEMREMLTGSRSVCCAKGGKACLVTEALLLRLVRGEADQAERGKARAPTAG